MLNEVRRCVATYPGTQARIQLLAKGEVVKIMENNSKCQRPHATKTSSATSSYEL